MNGFDGRIEKSEIAIKAFDDYLISNNIPFAKTGYEDFNSNGAFMEKIRKLNDETAIRMRYFPDRTVANSHVTLIEVKHSKSIEKDAYENYIDLANINYDVGIVFYMSHSLSRNELWFCKIKDLMLSEAWQYAKKHNLFIPVKNIYWYFPREMNNTDYYKWKKKYKGSGTPYANIDFDSTKWDVLNKIKDNECEVKVEKQLKMSFMGEEIINLRK